jgi:ABC-type iron transport system FetAB permease component
MLQIELILVNEFQKNNEKITNLIHHEYIEGSFLLNRIFIQRFKFYIIIIKKNWITKHAIIPIDSLILSQDMNKVYLFILCMQYCNNDRMIFWMYDIL